ncbi:MAG: hypothetical protein LUH36_06310 [Oscillospiraceae bacterium]|nr:hypothetical protein [Oscillospiraceae bacterium]
MQSEAYKLTGAAVVASAMGFMLRWLQNINILDEETGLAEKAPISTVMVLYIVIAALALVGYIIYLKKYDAPGEGDTAMASHTPVYTPALYVIAAMLAVSGVIQVLQAGDSLWPGMYRIGGLGTVIGAVGLAMLVAGGRNKENAPRVRRIGISLMLVFGAIWLISAYKDAATDPVLWRFAPEILAICAALMAFYYMAGYYFDSPHPMYTLFFCEMGAFLCVMSAIDDMSLAEALRFAAVALLLFLWGFVMLENLQKRETPLKLDEEA